MQLIVVGFHRSGTSLLTQLLHSAGLFVGDDLLGAMPSNPYGHFEDREVLELHRQVMEDHGVGWQTDDPQLFHLTAAQWRRAESFVQRRNARHEQWGFKEPRVCYFLGVWKYLLPDAKFVMVYRDPSDCVRSMESRQAGDYHRESGNPEHHLRFFTEPDHGLKVWDSYNRAMTAFARQHVDDCLVLPFTHLYHGYPIIERINQRFGTTLDQLPPEAVFDARATGARQQDQWLHDRALERRLQQTWQELERLTALTEAAQ